MNERVNRLRSQSVETRPYISTERAELMTDFYRSDIPQRTSIVVCRALSFKHLMEKKTICINDGELIVGERGPAPKATPTYPELCCHSMEDLRILNSRERTPFVVLGSVPKSNLNLFSLLFYPEGYPEGHSVLININPTLFVLNPLDLSNSLQIFMTSGIVGV